MDGKTGAEEATSTQKSLSSGHDPGWNDPPKWAFSPGQTTVGTPTKRVLNKRVAFPLSSASPLMSANSSPSGMLLPGNLPPPSSESAPLTSAPHAPFLAPTILQSEKKNLEIDKNEALIEVMKNFEIVINKELESSSKNEEVRRRLDTMKIMWQEDKLKNDIYVKVLEISKALLKNDVEGADKIHISLMMDNAALCNTWISGVRHIILELREKLSHQEKISSAKTDENPYLLPQALKSAEKQ